MKNFTTKIIKDKNGNLYTLIDFENKEIQVRGEDGFIWNWPEYEDLRSIVGKYKEDRRAKKQSELDKIKETKYLVFIDKRIPLEIYFEHLKTFKPMGGKIIFRANCPFHEDRHASLFVYYNYSFYCFSCSANGNVKDFENLIKDNKKEK